jgi:hypothetical protein
MSFESNGNVLEIKNADKISFLGSGGIVVPSGTVAQQPTGVGGMTRFNTTTNKMEFYEGAGWRGLDGGVYATGGLVTEIDGYRIHTFTNVGNNTFIVSNSGLVEYLIVAGGGSGGAGRDADNNTPGAGGGGGGVLSGKCLITSGTHTIVVGNGGASVSWGTAKNGLNGENSSFNGRVAIGGGGGRVNTVWTTSSNGGSGGGCAGGGSSQTGAVFNKSKDPGRGIFPQGNDGGRPYPDGSNASTNNAGGGGGGAGSKGFDAYYAGAGVGGDGGDGIISTISGSSITYAGGGGGAGPTAGSGGSGGGGNGNNNNGNASSGTNGLGGGGGGQRGNGGGNSGAGGSGIVIIRYLL